MMLVALLALLVCLGLVGVFFLLGWYRTTEPDLGRGPDLTDAAIEAARLERHVREMVELGPRDFLNADGLERVVEYISAELRAAGGRVEEQTYTAGEGTYKNVIGHFGPDAGPRIVAGAHYDTAGPFPGADDNASGIAGMLEIARALGRKPPSVHVELVAWCLEEPPFFRTPAMGSAVHAKSLKDAGREVTAMFSLEMLGFFTDAPGSQSYPAPYLRLYYPSVGNFIVVVSTFGQKGLGRRVKRAMRSAADLPVHTITASRQVPGVDFSDHMNYWDCGFPAVMITDTSFLRNPNYHLATDLPETLDYARMAAAVRGIENAIRSLAKNS